MSFDNYIFFFKPNEGQYAPFSNWYYSPFTNKEGFIFQTNEHYMMWRKAMLFNDQLNATKIINSENPKIAKSIGRQVKNFDDDIWKENAKSIVLEGLILKFSQNKKLAELLISTKNKFLVEASPYDKIWGIGLNESNAKKIPIEQWPGLNWLGECLMDARHKLKN